MSPDLQAFLTRYVEPFFTAGEACNTHQPPFAGPRWKSAAEAYAKAREAMYAEWARLTRKPE